MFTQILNNKIGNILVYMADHARSLSLTKALKLLYIIDETSMREVGVPVTWMEYKVWEHGPVSEDVYDSINMPCHCSLKLDRYITISKKTGRDGQIQQCIHSFTKFDDSDFTDYEIELIQRIISLYGSKSAKELIGILHKDGTLWSKQVESNRLNFRLQGGRSNVSIPLTELIKEDSMKQEVYALAYESLMFESSLSV